MKYLILGGTIKSQNDGDWHTIGFSQLIKLYGLNPRECIRYEPSRIPSRLYAKLIKIYPREDGKYDRI